MLGNILIMGDSYSTYEGMIPKGYATYYSKEGRADPAYAVTKMNVEDTWWMRLIRATAAIFRPRSRAYCFVYSMHVLYKYVST